MAEKKKQHRISKEKIVVPATRIVEFGETNAKGFVDFLRTQGVVGLAVGIVLGGAVSVLARSLIDNVIMPPVGLLLGSGDGLKGLSWTLGEGTNGDPAVLYYGTFINDLINFIILALVMYLVFHILGLTKLDKKKE
jgi:large conductance mechanosensitive channel